MKQIEVMEGSVKVENKDVFNSKWARDIFMNKYSMNRQETWKDTTKRVVENVCGQYLNNTTKNDIFDIIYNREFIPAGRYLYASGRAVHQINNCFCFRAWDNREGWAELMHDATSCLMLGGGIGVDYSKVRAKDELIKKTGGVSTGPIALMNMVNETGRHIMQGGQRRSAIWAGLNWKHKDIFNFMNVKDWPELIKKAKESDFNFPAQLDMTNISVIYDTEFFIAIEDKARPLHKHAKKVWEINCLQAFKSAEPGMSFNFLKCSESLRNACAEFTSEDNGDRCNLGTIWINRVLDKERLARVTELATKFLICGGLYSDVPLEKTRELGIKTNKIGLGIGGMHEWLMMRGMDYEVTPELHKWLNIYEQESDSSAFITAKELDVAVPLKKRAIAPNGTLGIIAESTTGIEPLFCKAYKRRYFDKDCWKYQYVVDGAVKRLMDNGVPMENIKDSYDITFKQRVKFQADVQNYVDMSISSTCNLPAWGSEENNEGNLKEKMKILLKYAKRLRGFTAYPDGCRSGQPLTRVDLAEALSKEGVEYEEKEDKCVGGVCGI